MSCTDVVKKMNRERSRDKWTSVNYYCSLLLSAITMNRDNASVSCTNSKTSTVRQRRLSTTAKLEKELIPSGSVDDFWKWAVYESRDELVTANAKSVEKRVDLATIVQVAIGLSEALHETFKEKSEVILQTITDRGLHACGAQAAEQDVDETVDAEVDTYCRSIVLKLKQHNMIKDWGFYSSFIGSRQQLLYGCVVFVLIVVDQYNKKIKRGKQGVNNHNLDWLIKHSGKNGCFYVLKDTHIHTDCNKYDSLRRVLTIFNCVSNDSSSYRLRRKSLDEILFDICMRDNPTGGMIGPGNSVLHKILLRTTRLTDRHKKMIKYHAAFHDACGYLLTQMEVGPGYTYGLWPSSICVVSESATRSDFITRNLGGLSWLGQLSGMISISRLPLEFEYDSIDRIEAEELIDDDGWQSTLGSGYKTVRQSGALTFDITGITGDDDDGRK